MISSRGRKVLAAVAISGGIAVASPALASCYITQQGFVAQDVTMDMGQIVILPSLPVGGVIKELIVPINQRNWPWFFSLRT